MSYNFLVMGNINSSGYSELKCLSNISWRNLFLLVVRIKSSYLGQKVGETRHAFIKGIFSNYKFIDQCLS